MSGKVAPNTPCLQEPEGPHPPMFTPLIVPLPLPLALPAVRVSCWLLAFWADVWVDHLSHSRGGWLSFLSWL